MLQCYVLTCGRNVTAFWRPLEVSARGKGLARPTQRPAMPMYSNYIFKNSQQIEYATDHGNSYAYCERNSPSFFKGKPTHSCPDLPLGDSSSK
jgi:hypothetical protein